MGKSSKIAIQDDAQKQKLIKALRHAIEKDCVEGRKFLDAQTAAGKLDKIPAHLQPILRQNIEAREAVYKKIIDDLGQVSTYPINADQYYVLVARSFATASIQPEYIDLLRNMTLRSQLPPDVIESVESSIEPLPEGQNLRGTIIVKNPGNMSLGDISKQADIVDMRFKTIHRIFDVAFDRFYQAAVKKPDERIRGFFMRDMEQRMGFGNPSLRE